MVATGLLGPGGAAHVIRERSADQTPTPASVPTVLSAASGTPIPTAPPLADVLERPLGADALGDSVAVSVVDLSTGTKLFTADADAALIPASTMKILTAAAALQCWVPNTGSPRG